jgi:hypothetical protein
VNFVIRAGSRADTIVYRDLMTTTVGPDSCDWPGLCQLLKLERETTIKGEAQIIVGRAGATRDGLGYLVGLMCHLLGWSSESRLL